MTREEFNSVKVGDFVTDLFNGFNRVYDVGTNSDGERYISVEYVEFDAETMTWDVAGLSWDITEYYAINEDNGRGLKRWEILTDNERAEVEKEWREDWEKFEAEYNN